MMVVTFHSLGVLNSVVQDPDIIAMQEAELNRLMVAADALKRKYDLYFMGMDKREPGPDRERLEVQLRKCRLTAAYKTSTRFRYQQFMARYRTYTNYWDRVLRQMEDGTYRKSFVTESERLATRQNEVVQRLAQGLDPVTGQPMADGGGAADESAATEVRRIREAARKAQEFLSSMSGGNRKKSAGGTPRPSMKGLYDNYISEKSKRGEDVSKVSYSKFSRSVEKQREKAKEKFGVDVDFTVRVAGDKVSIVAKKSSSKASSD